MSDDALELTRRIMADNARAHEEAKAEAARVRSEATDKEPFSRDAFENEMGQFGEACENRSQQELDQFEISYYLYHPEMKTLRELALVVSGAEIMWPPETVAPRTATASGPTGECPVCGGDASATGAKAVQASLPMLELECSNCHHKYFSWRRE